MIRHRIASWICIDGFRRWSLSGLLFPFGQRTGTTGGISLTLCICNWAWISLRSSFGMAGAGFCVWLGSTGWTFTELHLDLI